MMYKVVVTTAFLFLCTGLPSKATAWEEVQTTAWEGDTPISFDSFLKGSDSKVVPITQEPYPEDRSKRQAPGESPEFLMFANRQFLVQLHLSGSVRNVFRLPDGSNSIGLDYDFRAGLFFWSDVAVRIIAAARLNGTGSTALVNSSITIPDGIAWDWTTKKLYWTDANEQEIEVLDPARNYRKILLNTGSGSIPRAIVLDPTTRMMYWTDWGSSAKIEKASMDGTSRSVLIGTNLGWPNGLTLDYVTQTLYWCDAQLDRLEKCGTDGTSRMTLPTQPNVLQHPFGITFYMNRLYWGDWQTNAVFTAPISNTLNTTTVITNLRLDPMTLHVVAETRQPYVFSICTLNNGGCSHLCLLSSSSPRRYICTCPEGLVLDSDNRTCIDPSTVPPTTSPPSCDPSCQNGGQCINGHCVCSSEWTGYRCENPVCRPPCMNGGTCIAPDTCHCPVEYEGDRCEQPMCFPPDGCRNGGVCVRPGHCSCGIGWEGVRCDERICIPPCVHGDCLTSEKCLCHIGWNGTTCSQPICFPPDGCLNGGHCVLPGSCSCPSGWAGERCDEAICVNDCNQHGTCLEPNHCHCEPLWTGRFCEEAICFPPCQNGGLCVLPGTCHCPLKYEGHRCQTLIGG